MGVRPGSEGRRSIRLPGYDYASDGAYFVTFRTHAGRRLLGEVQGDHVALSVAGRLVHAVWERLPERWPAVSLDAQCVMPNHVHAILWLGDPGEDSLYGAATGVSAPEPTPTLGRVMRAWKSLTAVAINRELGGTGAVWQRGYYERVLRDETELVAAREYIATNPARWAEDREYHHP